MPRSTRDSDEESETKTVRRTRALSGTSVADSPLRRSNRKKPSTKQNESSPESPVSDTSSIGHAQSTRVTRKRIGTMDSNATSEKPRTLRSRKSSVSSDISEVAEIDVSSTPSKKTRRSITSVTLTDNKSNTRTRRLTRAGSEANSPPPVTRVTRRTRASSMEPVAIADLKAQAGSGGTPVKTRKRMSMVPARETVLEEAEESNEHKAQSEVDAEVTSDKLNESKSSIKRKSINEQKEDDSDHVSGPQDDPPDNGSKDTFKTNIQNTSADEVNTVSLKQTVENNTEPVVDTKEAVEQSTENETQKYLPEPTILLVDFVKEQENNFSNKENQTVNIISDIGSPQNTNGNISNPVIQSPKLVAANSGNKAISEKYHSSSSEENSTKNRNTKDIIETLNDTTDQLKSSVDSSDLITLDDSAYVKSGEGVKGTDTSQNEGNMSTSSNNDNEVIENKELDVSEQPLLHENSDKSTTVLEEDEKSTRTDNDGQSTDEMKENERNTVDTQKMDISETEVELGNEAEKITIIEISEDSNDEDITRKMVEPSATDVDKSVKLNESEVMESTQQTGTNDDKSPAKYDCKEVELSVTDVNRSTKLNENEVMETVHQIGANDDKSCTKSDFKEVDSSMSDADKSVTLNESEAMEITNQTDESSTKPDLKEVSPSMSDADKSIMLNQSEAMEITDQKATDGDENCTKDECEKVETEVLAHAEKSDKETEKDKNDSETITGFSNNCNVSDLERENQELETSKDITEQDGQNSTETLATSYLSEMEPLKLSDASRTVNSDTSIIIDEEITENVSTSAKEAATSLVDSSEMSDSLTVSVEPNDSTFFQETESIISAVKSSKSSIVTESPVECTGNILNKEEEASEKSSELEISLASGRKSMDKSKILDDKQKSKLEECDEDQEKMVVDVSDSEADAEKLFQDIPAEEWKTEKRQKNTDLDNNSVHSMSTERLGSESEVECEITLVNREAWLAAENLKPEKEKDPSDYDSDDTVVLKGRKESLTEQFSRKTSMQTLQEECPMDISGDEVLVNISRQSVTEDAGNVSGINKSTKRQTISPNKNKGNNLSTSELNASSRKSEGEKGLVESEDESLTENVNESLNKSKLDRSSISGRKSTPKRKSMNRLTEDEDLKSCSANERSILLNTSQARNSDNEDEEEEEQKKSEQIESTKKRKSLNKSRNKSLNKSVNKSKLKNEDESNNSNLREKSDKNQNKDRSLNSSLNKKMKAKPVDTDLINDNDSVDSENSEQLDAPRELNRSRNEKKKINRNYSTMVHIGSDSDIIASNIDSDSNDSRNNSSKKLPSFLFAEDSSDASDKESDDSSNGSIDSDVRREYNLDGEDVAKFSDDDVPGDVCRASESESSDPDDDGSDLADFVVDDDEVEDEEESEDEDGGDVFIEDGDDVENKDKSDVENADEDEDDVENEEVNLEIVVEDDEEEDDEGNAEDHDIEEEHSTKDENDSEEQDENESVIEHEDDVNEEMVNKSLNISKNKKGKPDVSMESEQKKKKLMANDTNNEQEVMSDTSCLSSSAKKRIKLKKKDLSHESEENVAEELYETTMIHSKKIQRLNKPITCSTPKSSVSKRNRFETTVQTDDNMTLESSATKMSNKRDQVEATESALSKKCKKQQSSLKEVCIDQDIEKKLLHKSLPNELGELLSKTNLSRPMSSKMSELHKTLLAPHSESPTTKYLRKEKLNESAPTIRSNNDDMKLMKSQAKDKRHSMSMQLQTETTIAPELSTLANREVLKDVEKVVESDNRRTRRKRKQASAETGEAAAVNDDNPKEIVVSKKQKHLGSKERSNVDEIREAAKNKKKTKKTESVTVEVLKKIEKEPDENLSDDIQNVDEEDTNNAVTEEKMKKRRKRNKNRSKSEDAEYESTDVGSHGSAKKNSNAKKLHKQTKEVPIEQQSEKKQQLLSENAVSKSKKASVKMQKSKDAVKTQVAMIFNKAIEEAWDVTKCTADDIKGNKEMSKKKQREHLGRTQMDRETKKQKTNIKVESIKVHRMGVPEKGIKRLPEEVTEALSDMTFNPRKKRKLLKREERILPSTSGLWQVQNIFTDEAVTAAGSTTHFEVVNLRKIKKQPKRNSAISSFTQKMLSRNSRHPISAYLMYLEKQKASGKNKFSKKPF